jgi:predicted transcriptional regulator
MFNRMEVHFSPDVQARLARLAAENHSGVDEYVQHLVERSLDYDVWFRAQVQAGLDQLHRGESLTHAEVGARIERMFRA